MRVLLSAAAALFISLGASAQTYSHEPDTYRHGGTYNTVQASSEQSCAETCRADTACLVWSFRKPHTGIGPSQCELKQSIGLAEENPTMTSGISPRIAGQDQATPRLTQPQGLLGGQTSQARPLVAPRPLQVSATQVNTGQTVTRRQRPTSSTLLSAAPSRPSGRVLSPNDPRIIRQGSRTAATAAAIPAPAAASTAPVRQATRAPQRQARPVLQKRPYDNLRNREFPQYSVQDNTAFETDTIVEEAATAAADAVGGGS